ncbi:DUF397 domain-containing protein [Streptomyces sp. NPDC091279]|uniref:DUF397 domain-containing protein n=1 Tax=Streptomyces sp. NPDC091279 TaxID=3365983 RepID=UPI003807B1AC
MSMSELHWFKSSYSDAEGHECVEVALRWSKSSYSGTEGGACVEVATGVAAVHVRDSKNPAFGNFGVSRASWGEFLTYASASRRA